MAQEKLIKYRDKKTGLIFIPTSVSEQRRMEMNTKRYEEIKEEAKEEKPEENNQGDNKQEKNQKSK